MLAIRIGDVAQLGERRVRNAKVRGSSPLISSPAENEGPSRRAFVFCHRPTAQRARQTPQHSMTFHIERKDHLQAAPGKLQ